MASKLRQIALGAQDIRRQTVTVPEWEGFTAEVRSITIADRAEAVGWARNDEGETDGGKLQVGMIVAATYDPTTNEKVFELADREALLQKPGIVLDGLRDAAYELNGLAEAAKDDAEKN